MEKEAFHCPHCGAGIIEDFYKWRAAKAGSAKSEKKAASSAANGKKGGRRKKEAAAPAP